MLKLRMAERIPAISFSRNKNIHQGWFQAELVFEITLILPEELINPFIESKMFDLASYVN